MAVTQFDHVNLRTAHLDRLVAFYHEVLGLEPGERPPFPFGGCWLYCDGLAVLHLVEVETQPETSQPRLEHFAFRAEGLSDFLAELRARKIAYNVRVVPGYETRQVNIHDPDGNHVHIDFGKHEEADLSAFAG